MPEPKSLSIDLLRTDAGTQSRIKINEEVVEDYADLIENSRQWPFEPLDVFHDGNEYFVANGFHRTLGAKRAKRSSVPCIIHKGTARDARIFGMTANDQNGLRMSHADKSACLEWLIENEKMTQAEMAEKAGVNIRTVKRYVADRKSSVTSKKGTLSPNFQGEQGVAGGSKETDPRPPRNGKDKPGDVDYGKCPNCASTKWDVDEFGVSCSKCHQPHGEPTGGTDEDRVNTQRLKTVKTAEALMRAFDDLNMLLAKPDEHTEAIASCKFLLKTARAWNEYRHGDQEDH